MRLSALLVGMSLMGHSAWPQENGWRAEVLLETEHGMGGAAVGDLDPESAGNEVVAVNAAGEVWMVRRGGDGWRPERIHKGEGELIMCAVGDVDPRHVGNEFVGVGMVSGDESLDHLVAGEIYERHAGVELVTCGHAGRLIALFPRE